MIIKLGNAAPIGPASPVGTITRFCAPDDWMWAQVLDALVAAWPCFAAGSAGETVPPTWVWTDEDEFTPHLAERLECPALTEEQVEHVEELLRVVHGIR